MKSYCFCPECGSSDHHWSFVGGITYTCDNCGNLFEDLDAAWWLSSTRDDFWDKYTQ